MPAQWPLTGRKHQLNLLREALGGGGAVLAGAAGVGKTRLAREALHRSTPAGTRARWVVATASARTVPLGAFADLAPAAGPHPTEPGALLQRLAAALSAVAATQGVLGVDDAHLLDDLSAALLHQLAVTAEVPLVVTVRSGEPAPDAVTALWKDGHLVRIEVPPLPAEDTAALVAAVLGGPLESHSARRLHAVSQGNVLLLRELVNGAVAAGYLRQWDGIWQWRGELAVTPPLAELVEARIGRLPPELQEVVDVLAFGEPLGLSLLDALTDPAAVVAAERAGLITVEPAGRRIEVRLAHPLYTDVIRTRVGALAARRHRRRLAERLAGTGARRAGDLLRRAMWLVDSDAPADPELFTEAAREALALYDVHLAERFARAALQAGAGATAGAVLGHALSWQRRPEEAERTLARYAATARTDGERAAVAVPRAANLFWTLGRARAGERILREASAQITDQPASRTLRAMEVCFAALGGRPADAAATAAALLAEGREADQPLWWAVVAYTHSLAAIGRCDEAVTVARTYLARIDRHPTAGFHRGTLRLAETTALRLAGRWWEAEQVAGNTPPLAAATTWGADLVGLMRGQVALDRGLPATAARWCAEALAGLAGRDPADWVFGTLLTLIQAHAMRGEAASARAHLTRAEAAVRGSAALYQPELWLARAWVAAAEGAVSEARQLARRCAGAAAGTGQAAWEMVGWHTAVCFGERAAARPLAALAPVLATARAELAAAHAAALATADPAGLADVARRLAGAGAGRFAADAAAQVAVLHHRQGRRAAAATAAAHARQLADACEQVSTPALRAAVLPLPLTAREREVATLASRGLSNREIATRLTVSVRTVEGHIYRACVKVDAANRAELVALVRPVEVAHSRSAARAAASAIGPRSSSESTSRTTPMKTHTSPTRK